MDSINETETSPYLVTHSVRINQHGIRLDQFLKDRYRKRSREQVKRSIESGTVYLERKGNPQLTVGRLKPSSVLMAGDEVQVCVRRRPEPRVDLRYKVLFEDEQLLIIDKPAPLPVHPAGRYFFNTLLIHLRTQETKQHLKSDQDYYLVHRIDKETSGVLLIAKDRRSCADLTAQFAARQVSKTYLAVVRGNPSESFTNDRALRRSKDSPISVRMETTIEDPEALSASTEFKKVLQAGDFALLECYPRTGRQHQIRVHLEDLGFPIVGDKLYGRKPSDALHYFDTHEITQSVRDELILSRHALHAAELRFRHPITKKEMTIQAPLPHELKNFLNKQSTQS